MCNYRSLVGPCQSLGGVLRSVNYHERDFVPKRGAKTPPSPSHLAIQQGSGGSSGSHLYSHEDEPLEPSPGSLTTIRSRCNY
ncbi:hypothetical protein E2C01_093094 [Portunus trituberculatus]|uniref:Uncharacterized protein n=1 Tax=Portunus trituberculatus TaxID=210409 RepID=A0A5B7JTL7_PORTR|nr:hypothetical protein [Portunus trituberculatus]